MIVQQNAAFHAVAHIHWVNVRISAMAQLFQQLLRAQQHRVQVIIIVMTMLVSADTIHRNQIVVVIQMQMASAMDRMKTPIVLA
jgi:hypothetical protein